MCSSRTSASPVSSSCAFAMSNPTCANGSPSIMSHVDAAFSGWSDVWLDPAFRTWNLEADLPRVTCPTLVIQGELDRFGTLAQIDAIVRQVSGPAERLVLPDCGHTPHRDQRDSSWTRSSRSSARCLEHAADQPVPRRDDDRRRPKRLRHAGEPHDRVTALGDHAALRAASRVRGRPSPTAAPHRPGPQSSRCRRSTIDTAPESGPRNMRRTRARAGCRARPRS